MKRSCSFLLAIPLSLLLAPPTAAQVAFEIQSPTPRPQDANFRVAGTYGFSVVWENPSGYRLYATSGNQRKTWHQGVVRDLKDFPPDPCPLTGNPSSPGWDHRCQEQVGLYWKYVDCGLGATCEWDGRWNAYPGTGNVSAFPISWLWPETHPFFGIPGHTPVLTKDAVNSPPICSGGACPPTGVAANCHPGNPGSFHKGVANGNVLQVWTASTLERPFVFQSQVASSMVSIGAFGWEFGLTQYPDNVDTSPRLTADRLDFWVVQNLSSQGQDAQVTVTRMTARVRGGIFGP